MSPTNIWDEILSQADLEKQTNEQPCVVAIGNVCPVCGKANLEYNGTLSLVCPECGQEYSGSYT